MTSTTKYTFPSDFDSDTQSQPPPYSQVCNVPMHQATQKFPALPLLLTGPPAVPVLTAPGARVQAQGTRIHRIERSTILCCGVQLWTQAIAGSQIFVSLFGLLRCLAFLIYSPKENNTDVTGTGIIDFNFQILEWSISLGLGCILLAGATMRKPALLLIWLIVSGIGFGFLLVISVLLIIAIVLNGGGSPVLISLILVTILESIQYFCIRVVCIHRRELITFHQNNNFKF